MDNKKPVRLLFISHDASLSGAPVLLLNLVNLLASESGYDIKMILYRGGVLETEFKKTGTLITLKPVRYQQGGFFSKLIDYVGYRMRLAKALHLARNSDAIFSNTITNGRLLKHLSTSKKPVVIYVHELESVIMEFNKHQDSDLSLLIASLVFSPSSAVTDNLVKNHGVKPEKILPLNYFFPAEIALAASERAMKKEAFFTKYSIPLNKFYVVGMGTATYRKGIDIFIDACIKVKEAGENIHFTWIGDFIEGDLRQQMKKKIEDNNLQDYLTITGFLPKSHENLVPFDLFILTSREDPYPLVVLEAAYQAIPSVCFSDGGGIIDFVNGGAGFIINEQSGKAVADEIIKLKSDTEFVINTGLVAKQKALNLHSSASLVKDQFAKAFHPGN
jgi:glycosyltransferase involved in cell wall biosynthesis